MLERGGATAARVYTAGQVARRLGIAETTLRSWHRRYRLEPHAARPGGYRRYTMADIVRLAEMRDLISSGMLASDAARTVAGPRPGQDLRPLCERLTAASRRLDSAVCQSVVAEALRVHGVVTTWEELCRPALLDVEAEQEAQSDEHACIPREHVLSWAISSALHQVPPARSSADHPAVMLASVDAEQHALPLDALAAALAERGIPVRMLGTGLPVESLVDAIRSTGPAVVVLWAQREETASQEALTRLRRMAVLGITAGPGWPPRRRGRVTHVDSLIAALAAVTGQGGGR